MKKYSPPPSESQVEITKDSVLLRLAQIASEKSVKINTSDIIKALELIGRTSGCLKASICSRERQLEVLMEVLEPAPLTC